MTNTQKAALAQHLITEATERISHQLETDDGYWPAELQGLSWGEVSNQLAIWFKNLPGDGWHMALPPLWVEPGDDGWLAEETFRDGRGLRPVKAAQG